MDIIRKIRYSHIYDSFRKKRKTISRMSKLFKIKCIMICYDIIHILSDCIHSNKTLDKDQKRARFMRQHKRAFILSGAYKFQFIDTHDANAFVRRFIQAIRPYHVEGHKKIRLGPYEDGGYAMLDPGRDD